MAKLILALLIGATMISIMPACNTVKGAGQDMQSGGQSVEKSAKENGAQ